MPKEFKTFFYVIVGIYAFVFALATAIVVSIAMW